MTGHIEFLKKVFRENPSKTAISWKTQAVSYEELLKTVEGWEKQFPEYGIEPGHVAAVVGDFSPQAISLVLALTNKSCLLVPQLPSIPQPALERNFQIAQVQHVFVISATDDIQYRRLDNHEQPAHELYQKVRERQHPGLILFSSGTSGIPKAAVHDFNSLLEKFHQSRPTLKILNFLLFDHWGGLNTMLHTLSSAGTVITVSERAPEAICEAIEKWKVEVLPASPTFLNLLLVSRAYTKFDLSFLQTITYGTEPMPESTLKRLNEVFPNVKLQQTYGLIELGVLRAKSKSNDSLWVKIGGEGYQTRVVDGLLQIKAKSAMLGYLNAPSPFTEDGWFMTGDAVEVEGEYFRILGRQSELINVGGEKVYPQEVESVIQEVENIAEVTVYGEKYPLIGNIVCARVITHNPEEEAQVIQRVKSYCQRRLALFKVPVRVVVSKDDLHNSRFKKIRAQHQ
jgi:long-chain acyl-CoA synthetase